MALAEREIIAAPTERRYTPEEYLALEEVATEKSEYVHGGMRLMSGGTIDHAAIPVSLGAELRTALRGRNCMVMSSDMKVYAAGQMYYPDVSVACGPREYYGNNRTVITNPILVAEVLSPGTENKDRGEKFHNYLAVESLRVYLLVSQDAPRIEAFSRLEGDGWSYTQAAGLESTLELPALSIALRLADIYDQIDFTPEAAETV